MNNADCKLDRRVLYQPSLGTSSDQSSARSYSTFAAGYRILFRVYRMRQSIDEFRTAIR